MRVEQTNMIEIMATLFKSVIIPLSILRNEYRFEKLTKAISTNAAGTIISISIKKVEDTDSLAFCISLCAKCVANLFLNPLPKPMSKLSIHINIELIVSQIPFLYSPRQCNVSGTMRRNITPDHPLSRKDIIIFFLIKAVRPFVPNIFSMVITLYFKMLAKVAMIAAKEPTDVAMLSVS